MKSYRVVHNESCYEVVELLHSGNIGNYPPGTVKEFDKAKFSNILEKIAKSFNFIQSGSGVIGSVTLGPTCPVEKFPPDPNCAPKLYETKIEVYKQGVSSKFTEVASDADGKFQIMLEPGVYDFLPNGGKPYPSCSPQKVTIAPQKFISVSLSCDTGIR